MQSYKTVDSISVGEITEKRSRFIATLAHVETEQQATDFINEIKSKYWDAKHNVYAYIINENNTVRFSDDSEPHGTAGKPILDVIAGNSLKNVVIVVTRYFGGILLGTGGLVRAYSAAAQSAVTNAQICEMQQCDECFIECDYSQYDKLLVVLNEYAKITAIDFEEKIKISFYLPQAAFKIMNQKITDIFFGRIIIKKINTKFFPIILK